MNFVLFLRNKTAPTKVGRLLRRYVRFQYKEDIRQRLYPAKANIGYNRKLTNHCQIDQSL